MSVPRGATAVVWTTVAFLTLVGVYSAAHRVVLTYRTLSLPADAMGELRLFDRLHADAPALMLLHAAPGILFLLLGPLQFWRRWRTRRPAVHRASGRVYLVAALLIGVSGVALGFRDLVGGLVERAAVLFFGLLFLYALLRAFWHVRRRDFVHHREWMLRAYALGLAVATIRLWIGPAMAITGASAPELFGPLFWLGFSIHALLAELWIRLTRARPPRLRSQPAARTPTAATA